MLSVVPFFIWSIVGPFTLGFGKTPVREADLKGAVERLALVDPEAETRTQHKTDRHQQPDDARVVTLDVINCDREDRRLIGLRAEIARRIANIAIGGLIMAANLGPLRLGADQIQPDRALAVPARQPATDPVGR